MRPRLKNRNIYRATDQTNRANSPTVIIRLIHYPFIQTIESFPFIFVTSLHHRVNTASRFRQTLKNNQNLWAHCRLIICHNLLAPLAEITKYTHNAKHTKESFRCSQPNEEECLFHPSLFLPPSPILCLIIRLYTFVESNSFFSGNRRELTLSGLSYNRNINEYVATL